MAGTGVTLPFSFHRVNRQPLDVSQKFDTLAEFELYLTNGPAYPGQIVSVRNDTDIPFVFVVKEPENGVYTYKSIGGDNGDIEAHNTSPSAHEDIREDIEDINERLDRILNLGLWAGTFDTYDDVPTNIDGFEHITVNDFIYIRTDENEGDLYTRYFVESIDEDTGEITWGLDRVFNDAVNGTMDMINAGDTFSVTAPHGGWNFGDTISATDSAYYIVKRLLNPLLPPVYVLPNLTLTGSIPMAREIGENVVPVLTPVWTQNDGGSFEKYRLYKDGSEIYANLTEEVAHTDSAFQLVANVIYNAQVDYMQGEIKNDSDGEPDDSGRIYAGTSTSNNIIYTPQRKAFYGSLTDDTLPDTSVFIRSLAGSSLNPVNNTQLTVDVPVGERGCVFAYPDTLKAPTSIIQQSLGFDLKGSFKDEIVEVEGANGYAPINYRVYYLLAEFPFVSNERIILTI